MPVFYKAAQSILENKAGKKLFYPRIVLKGNVTTDQIAREIAEYSSLSKGDTKNTIDNLVRVMTTHLQSSESVTLDGFGTFRMTMKSNGKGVEAADKVSASHSDGTLPAQLHQKSRPHRSHPLHGDRCQMPPLQLQSNRKRFRWWQQQWWRRRNRG